MTFTRTVTMTTSTYPDASTDQPYEIIGVENQVITTSAGGCTAAVASARLAAVPGGPVTQTRVQMAVFATGI